MSYLSKTIDKPMSPGEIRQRAQAWYDRQIEIISKAHGSSWPQHKDWVDDYLREQLRDRLHELGWRPKQ